MKAVQFKYFSVVLAAMLFGATASVFADNQTQSVFSTIDNSQSSTSSQSQILNSTPNSSIALDFSIKTAESWDERDQPSNMIVQCINGDAITGVEYTNVTIETVGSSFFSEAVIYFSDSNVANNGLNFIIGNGNENSGVAVFNSNGVVDITDSGNLDVVSLTDKKFVIQFYERIDDDLGSIDARFTNGVLKIWGVNLTTAEGCPFVVSLGGQVQDADLSVTYSLSSGLSDNSSSATKSITTTKSNQVGDTISFDIVVTNESPPAAIDVVIENMLSVNLEFVEFSCDDGTSVSSPDSIASVSVNDIVGLGLLNCTMSANIISAGSINSSVTVSASNDLNVANNSAAIVVAGGHAIVSINNTLALLLMILGLMFFARKYHKI
ncbi:MAG: DUF11 domain-containing protein [Proteobacteria bacterium]|nr:DUF11 domain-containing protein [Pseudomonadota bacterium]